MTQEIEYVYVTIGVDDISKTCTFELRPFIKGTKECFIAQAKFNDALMFLEEDGYTPIYIDKRVEDENVKKIVRLNPILQHIKTHRTHAR